MDMMDLSQLLSLSVKRKASDLHISPGLHPMLRIDGDLVKMSDVPPLDAETTRRLIYSVMDKKQQQAFETVLELDFLAVVPNVAGFRVNVFHQLRGIAAVFRIISEQIPTLDKIGAPPVIKQLMTLSSGLILVTGSTGCGKSTTLAAMVDYINTHHSYHITTIEDPIEFIHHSKKSLVDQRQVYRDTKSFSAALRSTLREDPDVILVGEMRDLETIRLVLTAAETGHLVMATLHTNSAPNAVSRIIDVFPTGEKSIIKNLISESLQAVICQTLVKRIKGGRIAVFEVMLGTPAIRNLIREDKIAQMYSVMQTSGLMGMCTMEQSLKALVDQNITDNEVIDEYMKGSAF